MLASPRCTMLLRQRRLRWLGHASRMEDGRIPKDILWSVLVSGTRLVGRPKLRYKDVCKLDMKALDSNTQSWESMAADRSRWCGILKKQLKMGEEKILRQLGDYS